MTQREVRAEGRSYGGRPLIDRRAARREALVAAGLELFGTAGYHATSVRQICEAACLTQRYFYESFSDKQALLLTVYEAAVGVVRERTVAAVAAASPDIETVARSALGEFIGALTEDERRGRIVLVEVVGVGPLLEARRHAVIHEFADLIIAVSAGGTEATAEQRLVAVGLVGAVNQLLVDWMTRADTRSSPELLATTCARLFIAAHRGFF